MYVVNRCHLFQHQTLQAAIDNLPDARWLKLMTRHCICIIIIIIWVNQPFKFVYAASLPAEMKMKSAPSLQDIHPLCIRRLFILAMHFN